MNESTGNSQSDTNTLLEKKEVLNLFDQRIIILQKREQKIVLSGDKELTALELHLNEMTKNHLQSLQKELTELANQIKTLQ